MGCDIHIYAEIKRNGRWFHLDREKICDDRNYHLFARLAGVRNYGEISPISPPRGLPRDISCCVQDKSDFWGTDGHSHSWLLASEIIGDLEMNDYAIKFKTDIQRLTLEVNYPHDARVVFWFDN